MVGVPRWVVMDSRFQLREKKRFLRVRAGEESELPSTDSVGRERLVLGVCTRADHLTKEDMEGVSNQLGRHSGQMAPLHFIVHPQTRQLNEAGQ